MSVSAPPARSLRVRLTREEHDRIWRYIVVDNETGCWLFTGSPTLIIWFRGRTQLVHRILWEHETGRLGTDEELRFGDGCRSKLCIAPAHRLSV